MIEQSEITIAGKKIPVYSLSTVIVGTGAAGLNCAVKLFREYEETGVKNPADQIGIVTEGVGLGTSNNSGSDKQTYYKMGTDANKPDSPIEFAKTLTGGGCCHGDVALIEGENSLRGFFHLADAGVPFPHTPRGGFIGYKTDHDPLQRGTSAGPWTSRFMVQKLLVEVKRYNIPFFNQFHALAVITEGEGDSKRACGLLCMNMQEQDAENSGLVLFNCPNVVMAGGGPGDLYEISVYPKHQMGPYAQMFEAGAAAHNLTESQFGLASLEPRWNLSGTYQQVIPRYFSTDQDGNDEQEFLNPWFESMSKLATDIFLKGYQWPFDHDRIADYQSSLIDVIVQNEMINKGRKVYMDFRENPRATDGLEAFKIEDLEPEALEYLEKSGAMQATPIERLAHMNQPSIDLYTEMGTDLWKEPLEIGICSQHCNGGFAVDAWWESTVPHLFVIGELAGTHGVKRPGGSALNAGQVGSVRAALRIAHIYTDAPKQADDFAGLASSAVERFTGIIGQTANGALDAATVKKDIQRRMSAYAGMVRSKTGVAEAIEAARAEWQKIKDEGLKGKGTLEALKVREYALAQLGFLEAIRDILEQGGGSRGSHLVADPSGSLPYEQLGDEWRYIPENMELRKHILSVAYDAASDAFSFGSTEPRDIPAGEFWFENTWAEYRAGDVFKKDDGEASRPYKDYQK